MLAEKLFLRFIERLENITVSASLTNSIVDSITNDMIASCEQNPTCEPNACETGNAGLLESAGPLYHINYGIWSRRHNSTCLFYGGFILSCFFDFKSVPNTLKYFNDPTNEYRNAGKI